MIDRFYFMNWRFLLVWLLVLFVGLAALIAVQPTQAQDVEATPEVTAPTITVQYTDGTALEIPTQPEMPPVDLDGLEAFLNQTQVIMGLLVFGLTALLKIALPSSKITTEGIYGIVVVVFTVIYLVANLLGASLQNYVDMGTIIANSIWALLSMLGVSSAAYLVLGKGLQNPLVARPQTDKAWTVGEPIRTLKLQSTASIWEDGLADQIAEGVARGMNRPT